MIDGHLHLMEYIRPFNCNGYGRAVGDGCIVYDTGEKVRILPEGMGDTGFSCEAALKLMDENQIEMAVLMQSGGYGFHNAYAMEAAEKYPSRFFPTASLDPYCLKRREILSYLTEQMGFRALKFEMSEVGGFHGYRRDFRVDGEEMQDVYETAQRKNMTIAFDLGGPEQSSYHVRELRKIVSKYEGINFIFCHILCPDGQDKEKWEADVKALKNENVWFDFSSLPHFLKEKKDFPKSLEYLERAIDLAGSRKLIWGSDAPSSLIENDYGDYLCYFTENKGFSADEIRQMTRDNAMEAYNITI